MSILNKNAYTGSFAFPSQTEYHGLERGLTKREYAAIMIYANGLGNVSAARAVAQADELFQELEKEK